MKTMKMLLFSLIVVLFSCSKEDEDTKDLGYNYYPIEVGAYNIYEVKEDFYDDFNDTVITEEYFLKELTDSAFTDGAGRSMNKLKRYTQPKNDTIDEWIEGAWKIKDVWTIYKGSDHLDRVEENVTFVKMSFPLRRSKTWDGNAKNDSSSQTYVVLDYDLKNKVGGQTFTKTCRINQKDEVNLIEEKFSEEIYARDFGLVQRINRNIRLNTIDSTLSGYDHQWTFVEKGTE